MAKRPPIKGKLTLRHKDFIINALACRVAPWMVLRMLKETFDDVEEDLSYHAIYYYSDAPRWKKEIEQRRAGIKENLDTRIPIASKENRLWMLEKIVDLALQWNLKTITKEGTALMEQQLGNALRAISQAQAEMEPFKVAPTDPSGKKPYTEAIDDEAMDALIGSVTEILAEKSDRSPVNGKSRNGKKK